jgi:hypothetical protein
MAVTVRRLRRVEAWDKWKAAGGARQIVVEDVLSAHVNVKLGGQEQLQIAVPLDSPALPYLVGRAVVRVDQDDATYDEWMIVDRTQDDESGTMVVTAAPFRTTDLAGSSLISRADSDGVRIFDFDSLGLIPADHITNWILPALAAAGFGWVSIGTMVPGAVLDLTFQWDNPLAALMRIAEATQTELDIRRNGDVGYFIDLVTKVNSGANTADLRVAKNLTNVSKDESTLEQATRVFPRGAATDGLHATMARATWQVTNVAGAVITLADAAGGKGPVQFDGQLVGTYLLKTNGILTQVTASSASAQTVTVASGAAIANGDIVGFRADNLGNDLTYLEDPVAVVSYGKKVAVKDVPDVPVTNNLVKNSVMRSWPGSASATPPNWTAVGAPAILKQTAAPYTALGGASIRVTSTLDAQGVVSDAQPITPTAANPFISCYAKLWVASGSARVELLLTTPSGTKVIPLFPAVASNSVQGQWVDLGVSGIDANAVAATAAAIRIVQNGVGAAVFYVDAAQITMSAAQLPFFEGSGGTRLWQEANEALRTGSNPLASYSAALVDLEALDPTTWSDSALIVGANARIVDTRLNTEITTRIIELDRDYFTPGQSSVILSTRFDDLTDLMAAPPRDMRAIDGTGVAGVDPTYPRLTGLDLTVKENGNAVAVFTGDVNTAQYKYLASLTSMPTDASVEATGTVISTCARFPTTQRGTEERPRRARRIARIRRARKRSASPPRSAIQTSRRRRGRSRE